MVNGIQKSRNLEIVGNGRRRVSNKKKCVVFGHIKI